MNLHMSRFLVLAFAIVCLALPLPSHAEEGSSIGVVDIEKLLTESKAGSSVQKQLDTSRESFQKEFAKKEEDLRAAEKKLIEEKGGLSAEDFAKRRQVFEADLLETKKLFQKRRNSLDEGLAVAMSTLRKEIVSATAEVAEQHGYDVVLSRDGVVIVEKKLDITPEVLKVLNEKVKDIKLEIK